MPSFSFEHERDRIAELKRIGTEYNQIVQSVQTNVRTNLLERTGALSPFDLAVSGDKVSQIGYEHRGDGDLASSYELSVEAATESHIEKRYRLENQGYEEVKKHFFALPPYSTALLLSPPPDEPIPGYPGHSMAYFYHILPHESGDENKRTIKALTWVNYFGKDEQAALLQDLGVKTQVEATEESILRSPVFVAGQEANTLSFRELWQKMGEKYYEGERQGAFRYPSERLAEQLLLDGQDMWEKYHGDLALMTTNLAERLVRGEKGEDFAEDWDIMLNLADQQLLHVDVTAQIAGERGVVMPGRVIFDSYQDFAYAPRVVATMCGESAGIATYDAVGGLFTTASYTVENVPGGNYTGENAKNDPGLCRCKGEQPHFHCDGVGGTCKHAIIVGQGISSCPSCGKGKAC